MPATAVGQAVCPAASADSAAAYEARAVGYERQQAGDLEGAIEAFRRSLSADPCQPNLQAQLGYAYTEAEDPERAIRHFEEARTLGYEAPRAVLQAGYLHEDVGDDLEARRSFAEAARGSDAEVADQALAELRVRGAAPGMSITEVYLAPTYQSRFDNAVFPLVVRSGPILTAPRLTQLFGFLRLTRDTRSGVGDAPQFYSENAGIIGAGLRFRPFGGTLTAYSELGYEFELGESPEEQEVGGASLQAGLYDFRTFGLHRDPGGTPSRGWFSELYLDGSYYSRFEHNVIGYGQLRSGYRANDVAGGTLDLYLPLLAVADVEALHFNNTIEAGVGARWGPASLNGLAFGVEYLGGRYLRGDVPGDRSYRDLRLTVTTPLYFALPVR